MENLTVTPGELLAKAGEVFGIQAFRPGQLELLQAVLGERDALGILPTGGGKSLVFQLASLFLPRPVIVVTPLISLAEDQTDKLERARVAATRLDSSLNAAEAREATSAIASGKLDLVYVTPERLQNPEFMALLAPHGCSLFVIDEAHCVSQWGHDFRPAYSQLRHAADALGRPPILALTATATRDVEQDISESLVPSNPVRVRTPGERKNLHYSVRRADGDAQKVQLLDQILETEPGSSLIYCSTIKAAKLVHAHLVAQNLEAGLYHGDLHPRVRDTTQDAFMDGRYRIIVATKAFGMGIDKPNTRLVVHYQLPDSIESYVQESGRAGRDGKPARCILLFDPKDERTQQYFLRQKQPPSSAVATMLSWLPQQSPEDALNLAALEGNIPERWRSVIASDLARLGILARHVAPNAYRLATFDSALAHRKLGRLYADRRTRDRKRLERIFAYGDGSWCRAAELLRYFGDASAGICARCDNCVDSPSRNVKRIAASQTVED